MRIEVSTIPLLALFSLAGTVAAATPTAADYRHALDLGKHYAMLVDHEPAEPIRCGGAMAVVSPSSSISAVTRPIG